MELITPSLAHLPGYVDALQRGWSADTLRAAAANEELTRIAAAPAAFIASCTDREAKAGAVWWQGGLALSHWVDGRLSTAVVMATTRARAAAA